MLFVWLLVVISVVGLFECLSYVVVVGDGFGGGGGSVVGGGGGGWIGVWLCG